jgi:UDP:flavonoid glycosyltransferase YjiC (YdhE family)
LVVSGARDTVLVTIGGELYMRVLLAPHGTRGDVQPLLALALGLRGRGHDVSFLVPDNFVPWIRGYGFACEPNGVDVEALFRAGADLASLRWQLHHFKTVLVAALFESFLRITVDADIIVGAGVQLAASSVAELHEIAYASAVFCPCVIPNSDAPPPGVRAHTLPRWANRLLWQLGMPIGGLALRGVVNKGRARLGLEPVSNPLALIGGEPVIVAADRELAPLAGDAPEKVTATDAWVLDEPAPYVDPRVEEFLEKGPPPIYVGFGSMVSKKGAELAAHAIDAARALGCRLLLAGGWAALDRHVPHGEVDAEDVLAVAGVPHRAVFPRVAAVVHHGGAGTTTAAAAAGVPQVILPHLLDQYYWAHRVEQLGLGPRSLPVELVTADVLTDRIATALEDWSIREHVRALAPAVASRNGVADAIDHLERIAGIS